MISRFYPYLVFPVLILPFSKQKLITTNKTNEKHFLSIAIIAIAAVMSSCGSSPSFDSDVRKMADCRCKKQQLQAKDPADEKTKKELEELEKQMDAKAEAIMKEVMDKCK